MFLSFGNKCQSVPCRIVELRIPLESPSLSRSKVESPMTTSFDCSALSLLRLMWPIRLCHNSLSELALMLFANMADFMSCESRMSVRPALHLRVIIQPSFLMKQPPWSNQACMPCSIIWPTETKFFVIVGTCKTFLM